MVATDPNGDTLTYQLIPAPAPDDGDVNSFSIDKATGQIRVDSGLDFDMNGTPPDGKYLVVVRATDPSGQPVNVTVTITATDANDAPVIMGDVETPATELVTDADPAPAELRVAEQDSDDRTPLPDGDGMPDTAYVPLTGNVFRAHDEDARGNLTWTLAGDDADDFVLSAIDSAGQQLVGDGEPIAVKFKSPPDYETPTDANGDSVYEVTLVVSDDRATDERPITVFVTNVNEQGSAMLMASDQANPGQPLVGQPITAEVMDPDDGVTIVTWQWRKAETRTATDFAPIPGATAETYTPVRADNGMFLRAIATYIDMTSAEDALTTADYDERVQDSATESKTPTDGDGVQLEAGDLVYRVMVTSASAVRVAAGPEGDVPSFSQSVFERSVVEGAETTSIVGDPVEAMYDGSGTLQYVLEPSGSDDNRYFEIDSTSGQIRVGSVAFPDPTPNGMIPLPTDASPLPSFDPPALDDVDLDYEVQNIYTVVVTARVVDNQSRKDTATVTVRITNLNEAPWFDKASRDRVETVDAGSGATTTTAIQYGEKRTTAVVSLAAKDPDGSKLRWEVTGADAGSFAIRDIADGIDGKDRVNLVFKDQPDFETRGGADDAYNVTVRATEMSPVGGGPAKSAELDVMVVITNVDEKGQAEVRWLQPEVGTPTTATLTDPDRGITGEGWRWFRSKVANPDRNPDIATLMGTDVNTDPEHPEWEWIDDGGTQAYTPVAADEDKFLLVRATYTDTEGGDKSAIGISANAVRADVLPADNNSPDFESDKATRTVPENIAVGQPVGSPVRVTTNEDVDILTYELDDDTTVGNAISTADDPDIGFFSIDKATGQIRVAKRLSYEGHTDTIDGMINGRYQIVVRATDASGETGGEDSDDIMVVITATQVNEAPSVTEGLAELTVNEMDSSKKDDDVTRYVGLGYMLNSAGDALELIVAAPNLYHVTDEDDPDRASWALEGTDRNSFQFSIPEDGIGRRLHFGTAPDYEDPQDANRDNVYEVTVVARDNARSSGQKSVRVEVMNVDEDGKLTLLPEQPHKGAPVTATLEDPDGVESITDWKWWVTTTDTAPAFDTVDPIDGATTSSYEASVGEFAWARVEYRDGASVEEDPVTVLDERNDDLADAAIQTNHDSDEALTKETDNAVQADPASDDATAYPAKTVHLEVPESTPSTGYVGTPLQGLGPRDTIGGPDGTTFVFAEDEDNAVANGYYDVVLAPTDDIEDDKAGQLAAKVVTHFDFESDKNTYTIEVADEDAEIEIGVITVNIQVTDVNEAPSDPMELLGLQISGVGGTRYDEGTDDVVATYQAVGADMVTWSLTGADVGDLAINGAGELTFRNTPDYENPADADGNNVYQVRVTARGGNYQDFREVAVTVNNVDEAGTVTLTPMTANVDGEIMAAVTDIDGGVTDEEWQWARSDAMDGTFTDIEDATSASYMPVEDDQGMYLRASVTYTDAEGPDKTESAVTTAAVGVTMDNPGSVSLSSSQPAVGRTLTARLSDADNPTGEEWQWSSSDAMDGTFTDIDGATSAVYTPVTADETMYLKAMVMYTDDHGSGKMEEAVTANPVIVIAPSTDECIEAFGTLSGPETRMGTWASDCMSTARSGSYAEYYTFTLDSPMRVGIYLTSALDTYLYLREGDARNATLRYQNDDVLVGRNPDSRIEENLLAGTYTIEATTYVSGRAGTFMLDVREITCVRDLGTLAATFNTPGTLSSECESTQRTDEVQYARSYQFIVDMDTHLRIDLTSAYDTYLYVLNADGTVYDENDDVVENRNPNSRLDRTFETGTYTIEATTYRPMIEAEFILNIGYIGAP